VGWIFFTLDCLANLLVLNRPGLIVICERAALLLGFLTSKVKVVIELNLKRVKCAIITKKRRSESDRQLDSQFNSHRFLFGKSHTLYLSSFHQFISFANANIRLFAKSNQSQKGVTFEHAVFICFNKEILKRATVACGPSDG
jgi:hypothetical protein